MSLGSTFGDRADPVAVDVTRRRFLIGGVSLAAVLAGCAAGPPTAPSRGGPGWRFTDDRGVAVSRPGRPARVVANDQAGAALISLGVRPVGIFSGAPVAGNPSLDGVDLAGTASLGEAYGEIDVEQLAALRPDLVVVPFDPRQDGPPFGFSPGPVQGQVESIAPIVALDGIRTPTEVLARFAELAVTLGADQQAPGPATARGRYEDARARLRDAVAAKPGLRAVAVYASPGDGVYFCRPDAWPGLAQLRDLGLDIVDPQGDPGDVNDDFTNFFYDRASLELAGKYPADLILLSSGSGEMSAVPTWTALPAVRAGQVVPFRQLGSWTYDQNAGEIDAVAAAVRAANPALV